MKKNNKTLNFNQEKEEDQESVLGISDSDDELEDDDSYLSEEDEFGNIHEIRAKKQEMDSDLDEDDDDGKFIKEKKL